jgi:hypothetical protein
MKEKEFELNMKENKLLNMENKRLNMENKERQHVEEADALHVGQDELLRKGAALALGAGRERVVYNACKAVTALDG